MERDIFWAPVDGIGLEHLRLWQDEGGIHADGVVIRAALGETPLRLHYRLRCDAGWRVREARLSLLGGERRIALTADGDGSWTAPERQVVGKLDGAIDVDISVTPFTNTLPIRRLDLEPGQSREITVAYLLVPELRVQAARQRYTCLEREDESIPTSRYRYESLASGFTAEIVVDADGLVLDYPGLFRRV